MKPQMDHEELARRIEIRLDKIEEKLDRHIQVTTENEIDLRWVKGSIKLALSAILGLMGAVSATLVELFIKR